MHVKRIRGEPEMRKGGNCAVTGEPFRVPEVRGSNLKVRQLDGCAIKAQKIAATVRGVNKYLARPLSEYEDYKDLPGDPRYKKITARMLLSHTSRSPNWRWFNDNTVLRIYFEARGEICLFRGRDRSVAVGFEGRDPEGAE